VTPELTAEQVAALKTIANGAPQDDTPADWLAGTAMDPVAEAAEPLPTLPGFPFLHAGAGAMVVGPTGGGRSSLVQACAYDAARAGLRVAYLGGEVTEPEFNARAADIADRRGDPVDDQLRGQLAQVRYLNLASVIAHAWQHPGQWVADIVERFDVVQIDPLSTVASVLDLDFDRSNAEFVRFYDRLVQPVATEGVAVVLLDNLGHALEARKRPKGASAKQDRADLTFYCKLKAKPLGLIVTAGKVRTVRAPFARGDSWVFDRESQRIRCSEEHVDDDGGFRPTVLMERASKAIEQTPGLSKRAVRDGVKGDNRTLEHALELLVLEDYVEARPEGNAVRHYSKRPYRQADEQPPNTDNQPHAEWPA
jgi:hypothetical protein